MCLFFAVDDLGTRAVLDALFSDEDFFCRLIRGDGVHDIGHDALHDAAQAARADLHLYRLIRNRFKRCGFILKVDSVIGHERLVLAGHGVLRLCENTHEVIALEALERCDDRQTADKLRDDAELEQIVLLHLRHDLTDVTLGAAGVQFPKETLVEQFASKEVISGLETPPKLSRLGTAKTAPTLNFLNTVKISVNSGTEYLSNSSTYKKYGVLDFSFPGRPSVAHISKVKKKRPNPA